MHIKDKLAEAERDGKTLFSFEYFPPKTAQGVQNLYDRMDRMHAYGPAFIDITWNAGGRLSNLTTEMVNVAQSVYGLETCMHLTCTDMEKSKVDGALKDAYNGGCTNILALRGDPPRDNEKWSATEDGFSYAKDLVKHIRKQYGDYFDIGVAGYPEGCDDQEDLDLLLDHLKEKVDAGATFIITQMFYDVDIFLDWVAKVRAKGITIPIIPGIMPIHTYAAFIRRAQWTKCHVPQFWMDKLDAVKNDDVAVRDVGRDLMVEMCQKIVDAGIRQLHFYTMNLATATRMILEGLNLLPNLESPTTPALPFRPSLALGRREENVRPIFWKNRSKSYITRTKEWDEFPNGRWGDSRSPAYGELDAYGIGLRGSNEQNVKTWGEPASAGDIADLFVKYMEGNLDTLPWSDAAITAEAKSIKSDLVELNKKGFLTINSQPAVNGIKSSDSVHGWGPKNGYVYQKAYLELLVSPELLADLVTRIERDPELSFYAVDKHGSLTSNAGSDGGPNAVTWGVFPGKEIIQPTIVEMISFLAWKDEFFRLGEEWAACYPATSRSRYLINGLMNEWVLLNIVDNNFNRTHALFDLFKGLELKSLHEKIEVSADIEDKSSKLTNGAEVNGDSKSTAPLTNGKAKAPTIDTSNVSNAGKTALTNGVKINGFHKTTINGVSA